jgi:hypothetical protein
LPLIRVKWAAVITAQSQVTVMHGLPF